MPNDTVDLILSTFPGSKVIMDKEILLIDMSAIFYMAHHATADAPLSEAMKITLETVDRIKKIVPDAIPVVCCDSKTNWRKKLDPTYKANREKQPSTFYAEMDRVKDRLRKDGLLLLEFDGYEADDVIASICVAETLSNVVIASPDKDLLQLVRPMTELPEVRQLRTHDMLLPDGRTPKLWGYEMVLEVFGVPPHRIGDYLAIVGDTSDNVIGIEGVGGKGAASLIAEYGSLDMIITNYESNRENPFDRKALSRWRKALIAFFAQPGSIDRLKMNRELVYLKKDLPIDVKQIFEERTPLNLTDQTSEDEQPIQFKGLSTPEFPTFYESTNVTIPVAKTPMYNDSPRPSTGPITTSGDISLIAGALAIAQGSIQGALKDSDNPFFKSKYADLASVWAACRKHLSDNGIAVVQIPNGNGSRVTFKNYDRDGKKLPDSEGTEEMLTTLLIHSSGQWIGGSFRMISGDVTPQAAGSCITYMRRYSLAAMVGVAPEDDDGNAATARKVTR